MRIPNSAVPYCILFVLALPVVPMWSAWTLVRGMSLVLASCVMGVLILRYDAPVGWTVLAGLGVAILCALFVGGTSILLGAPSFIVSLACIGIFRGIALALTKGNIQTVQQKVGMPAENLGEETLIRCFVGADDLPDARQDQ